MREHNLDNIYVLNRHKNIELIKCDSKRYGTPEAYKTDTIINR